MKRIILLFLILPLLAIPVRAMEFEPPTAPDSASELMPKNSSSFSEDLIFVLKKAIEKVKPETGNAAHVCLSLLCVSLLISVLNHLSGNAKKLSLLVGTTMIGVIMLRSMNSMTDLGVTTINELSEYGKILLPVMTAALAAQGGMNTSAALYTATAAFSVLLCSLIVKVLIPMLYLYMCVSIANSAIGENTLKQVAGCIKWLITWSLKIILYVFTGYITVTGVVSGSVDATAVKATRLTISGAVPVVGNILADASETILLSAGLMKNSAGVYGLIAFAAILIGPFLKIAFQYAMLKITAMVSGVFDVKDISDLIGEFSSCMGFILAMTGAVCLMFAISIVCFMKGVT